MPSPESCRGEPLPRAKGGALYSRVNTPLHTCRVFPFVFRIGTLSVDEERKATASDRSSRLDERRSMLPAPGVGTRVLTASSYPSSESSVGTLRHGTLASHGAGPGPPVYPFFFLPSSFLFPICSSICLLPFFLAPTRPRSASRHVAPPRWI